MRLYIKWSIDLVVVVVVSRVHVVALIVSAVSVRFPTLNFGCWFTFHFFNDCSAVGKVKATISMTLIAQNNKEGIKVHSWNPLYQFMMSTHHSSCPNGDSQE